MNTLDGLAPTTVSRLATGFLLAVALSVILQAQQAIAQQGDSAAPQAEEDDSWKSKSLRQLRKEYQEAEEGFYDAFNAINSDDEFDISCKNRKPLGSRKRERVCQAKFRWDYESELASAFARANNSGGLTGMPADQTARMEQKQNQLRAEMSSLIAEVPVVKQAFAELARAKQHYEAKMAD